MGDFAALRSLSCRAYVWGYPFVRSAQLRSNLTRPRDPSDPENLSVAGAPLNTLGHARTLATPATRVGVAPNNDTLYSLAWLDLAAGPFILHTPDFGDRYYTFQLGQADSSSGLSFGQRTHGGRLPPLFIRGPGAVCAAPVGMEDVRSHYRYLMVAARILVDGPGDLPSVHRLQNQMHLTSSNPDASIGVPAEVPSAPPCHKLPRRLSDSRLEFLSQLGEVITEVGASQSDRAVLASFAPIGLSADQGFLMEHLDPPQCDAIASGLCEGDAMLRARTRALGRQINGWSINYRGSNFGDDHLLRAAVAMDQIYIVEAAEALYPCARVDSLGETLNGCNRYRIRFEAGNLPPVGAFWSITLYFAEGFMVPNPIDRWSIGDRTPGLSFEDSGALEILIQHEMPAVGSHNWLPAPAGPFKLLMRLYHPLPLAASGDWLPPPVEKIAQAP